MKSTHALNKYGTHCAGVPGSQSCPLPPKANAERAHQLSLRTRVEHVGVRSHAITAVAAQPSKLPEKVCHVSARLLEQIMKFSPPNRDLACQHEASKANLPTVCRDKQFLQPGRKRR